MSRLRQVSSLEQKDEVSESSQIACERPRSNKGPAPLVPVANENDLVKQIPEYIASSSEEVRIRLPFFLILFEYF